MTNIDPTPDTPSPKPARITPPPPATQTDDLFRLPSTPDNIVVLPDGNGDGPPEVTIREIGDYRIIREIGRGGMGLVYEAEQISLNRRVALKILPTAAVLDQRQLQRFKNEAQAAAMLHHPNIVPIFGVGSDRGVHFFAMHFVDGPTLADIIKELRSRSESVDPNAAAATGSGSSPNDAQNGNTEPHSAPLCDSSTSPALARISAEQSTASPAYFRSVVKLAIQVADALQHAHELGILHRDIKPSNLLFDERGNVWVTDFGLARVRGDAELTLTGDLVGTLRYMSPEQALAKRVPVDHRTDIYSLGVTLYELVTLMPAVRGADRQEILQHIAFEEPHPPRRVNKRIPVELETIILKATAKNPASRYDSAADLADDLRNFLDDKPIKARRATIAERAFLWSRRHRTLVGAALLLLVTVAIGSSIAAITIAAARNEAEQNAESERLARADAEAALKREAEARAEAEKQRQEAQTALVREAEARKNESAALADAERQTQIAQQNFRKARQAVDDFYTTVSQSTLLEAPGSQPLRKELLEAALEYYKGFAEQATDDPVIKAELAKTYFRVAELTNSMGSVKEAVATAAKAVEVIEELRTKYPNRSDWQVSLAGLYTGPRFLSPARFNLQEGLVAHRTLTRLLKSFEAIAAEHPEIREFKSDVAGLVWYLGVVTPMRPLAAEHFRRAYGIWKELHAADPKSAFYRRELARSAGYVAAAVWKSDAAQAEKLLREAKQLLDALVVESSDVRDNRVLLAQACAALAEFFLRTGRLDEAEKSYREAVQRGQELLLELPSSEANILGVTSSLDNLATVLKQNRRADEADEVFQQGVKLFRELLDKVPVNAAYRKDLDNGLGLTLTRLGMLRREQGKSDQAVEALREAVTAYRKGLGDEHKSVAWARAQLGITLVHKGAIDESIETLRNAVAIYRKALGNEHDDLGWSLAHLGIALREKGALDEAAQALREAVEIRRKALGNEHGWVAWTLGELGITLRKKGELDQASEALREALEIRRKENWDTDFAVFTLAAVLMDKKDSAAAEALYEDEIAFRRKKFGDAHESVAGAHMRYGNLFRNQKAYDKAERELREARDIYRKLQAEATNGKYTSDVCRTTHSLAHVLHDRGDPANAVVLFRESVELSRGSREDKEVANDLQCLTGALLDAGDLPGAQSALEEELAIRRKASNQAYRVKSILFMLPTVRLGQGNVVGYDVACGELLAQFASRDDAAVCNAVAWSLVLSPGGADHSSPAVALAEKAVQLKSDDAHHLGTLGVALYRAGQFQESIERMTQSMEKRGGGGNWYDWLFLAMAHHKLGHADEAKSWLTKTRQWILTNQPKVAQELQLDTADVEPAASPAEKPPDTAADDAKADGAASAKLSWSQRLELTLFYREAALLIAKDPK